MELLPKDNPHHPRRWFVSYGENQMCFPDLLSNAWDKVNGLFYLYFSIQGRKFSAVFDSKSSYMAAEYGSVYPVTVMNEKRTTKIPGKAVNMKVADIIEQFGKTAITIQP